MTHSSRHPAFSIRFPAILIVIIMPLMVFPWKSVADEMPDPNSIVEKADLIRFPSKAFQVKVKVTTTLDDDDADTRLYQVLMKGSDKSLIRTLEPAIDAGQILLMKETSLWAFMPNVSQPIRLPLAQKLTGQVANGDLARAKFAGDYNAEILRTETIGEKEFYLLELTARHRRVTYHRILYWVSVDSYQPFKAEFYSLSNRLLKTCEYTGYTEMGGGTRPTRLVMTDALRKGERSVLEYSEMTERDLPDKVFTKQYLKKLH